ncbi:hypothetical protein, partial [Salmonella sp. s51228]|uniref:hypothetical protein n=1 Tax=Salmonella sp. s51228 TaxID=3159652 RepID=UPI0039812553
YNEAAAKLRLNSIFTDLSEELAEYQAKSNKRSLQQTFKVLSLRIFFNLLTFFLLIVAGVIIFFTTVYALAKRCPSDNEDNYLIVLGINIPGIISSITIVMLNFILQFIFPFFARFESFRTQRGELRMTLIRSVSIR